MDHFWLKLVKWICKTLYHDKSFFKFKEPILLKHYFISFSFSAPTNPRPLPAVHLFDASVRCRLHQLDCLGGAQPLAPGLCWAVAPCPEGNPTKGAKHWVQGQPAKQGGSQEQQQRQPAVTCSLALKRRCDQ